ncbi:MAG: zf-HC2 domain-containing protein [Pyrinomonadaceae bacterium]|jgi:anti-sigma factor RsiW|nr:zf-HC2 domain-containing protein [Pyrinomonadaceae bacterium]
MLCTDFENLLSDYLEGILDPAAHRAFSEHALRCPVCHQTLSEVKDTMHACRVAAVPQPTQELEARILKKTMPEAAMSCQEFEESLTDYLDGFLPAPFYHRWERHAALCDRCTELPGEVVRSIGACYTYINEEMPVPAGLNERILQATIGTLKAEEVRAPWSARLASQLRIWLDPIVSPQLATVATMLLVAVFVLTNTVSADGSISGVYRASLRLAEQSYSGGSEGGIKGFTNGLKGLVGGQGQNPKNHSDQEQKPAEQKPQSKQEAAGNGNGEKKR